MFAGFITSSWAWHSGAVYVANNGQLQFCTKARVVLGQVLYIKVYTNCNQDTIIQLYVVCLHVEYAYAVWSFILLRTLPCLKMFKSLHVRWQLIIGELDIYKELLILTELPTLEKKACHKFITNVGYFPDDIFHNQR